MLELNYTIIYEILKPGSSPKKQREAPAPAPLISSGGEKLKPKGFKSRLNSNDTFYANSVDQETFDAIAFRNDMFDFNNRSENFQLLDDRNASYLKISTISPNGNFTVLSSCQLEPVDEPIQLFKPSK